MGTRHLLGTALIAWAVACVGPQPPSDAEVDQGVDGDANPEPDAPPADAPRDRDPTPEDRAADVVEADAAPPLDASNDAAVDADAGDASDERIDVSDAAIDRADAASEAVSDVAIDRVDVTIDPMDAADAAADAGDAGVPVTPSGAGWARRVGGTGNDSALALAVGPEGHLYVAGVFNGTLTLEGTTLSTTAQAPFLASYTASGALRWARAIGSSGSLSRRLGLATDGAGNVFLAGDARGVADFGCDPPTPSRATVTAFVASYTSAGRCRWARHADGAESQSWAAATDSAGNLYVGGVFVTSVSFGGATLRGASGPDASAFVLSMTGDGVERWSRAFTNAVTFNVSSITTDARGEVTFAGVTGGSTVPTALEMDLDGVARVNRPGGAFLATYSRAGAFLRGRVYGDRSALADPFVVSGDDGERLVGFTLRQRFAAARFDTATLQPATGTSAAVALSLSPSDTERFARAYGTSAASVVLPARGLRGERFLVDSFLGPLVADATTLTPSGGVDVALLSLDAGGRVASARTFGGPGNEVARAAAVGPDGALYLAGSFEIRGDFGAELVAAGGTDAFVLRVGAPVTGCGAGLSLCNGRCVDPRADATHCGACGVVCEFTPSAPLQCVAGRCVAPCAAGETSCAPPIGPAVCANLNTSATHCGACNRACSTLRGQVCASGTCACPATLTQCTSAGIPFCRDLATDPQNCGACLTYCGSGMSCVAGRCVCPAGQTACAGACADLATSATHCGACGSACAAPDGSARCLAGVCRASACPADRADCDGAVGNGCEARTDVDTRNCGACGRACGAGQRCLGGTCCVGVGCASSGSEGAFAPSADVVLSPGVHEFTTIQVPAGVTVRTSGRGVLDLRASGAVTIQGTIDLSGADGQAAGACTGSPSNPFIRNCLGGAGGATGTPGAGGGGDGGGYAIFGTDGESGSNDSGGGGGGVAGGGGGMSQGDTNCRDRPYPSAGRRGPGVDAGPGGYCTRENNPAAVRCEPTRGGQSMVAPYAGGDAALPALTACSGGGAYWRGHPPAGGGGGSIGNDAARDLPMATTFLAGSGGGGGGGALNGMTVGGGGGGGGGALRILSATQVTVTATGRLLANGGNGARNGGGGSGGAIFLGAPAVTVAAGAVVSARGGAGAGDAGAGGVGRVRMSVDPARCALAGAFTPALASGCTPTASPGVPGSAFLARWPE